MKVEKVFINTYRYDFHLAKICIASVRHWYPHIPIFLIKDENSGKFATSRTEKIWNVQVLQIPRKKFGWGYGKLETLFLEPSFSYLVLDADTVLAGPIFNTVKNIQSDFVVDDEVQPVERFNEIYYNLNRINELDESFVYPGYSFNSGQWFGTTGKITRDEFRKTLDWSEPPACRFPDIVFNGDQAHLNFAVHKLEQQNKISVSRIKLMIWPTGSQADFIDLKKIELKNENYPYIIHWAGMGTMKFSSRPRHDILAFYRNLYYSRAGHLYFLLDKIGNIYNKLERKVMHRLAKSNSPS